VNPWMTRLRAVMPLASLSSFTKNDLDGIGGKEAGTCTAKRDEPPMAMAARQAVVTSSRQSRQRHALNGGCGPDIQGIVPEPNNSARGCRPNGQVQELCSSNEDIRG